MLRLSHVTFLEVFQCKNLKPPPPPHFKKHAWLYHACIPFTDTLCSLHSSCEKLRPSHTSMEVGGQGREREKRERAAWTGTPRGRVLNAAGEIVHHLGVDPLPPSAFSPTLLNRDPHD